MPTPSISHFSTITATLHALTQQGVPFQLTIECEAAFDRIKYMLTIAPVLRAPLNSDFFIFETDAWEKGEGGCLKVCSTTNGAEHTVACASQKFNDTEARWNIFEKEARGLTFGTTKFGHYLFGKQFLLRTDNRINTLIQLEHEPKSRKFLNWALELSEFDYKIQHIPSKNNGISDCLIRVYCVNVVSKVKPEFSIDELTHLQANNPDICAARDYLSTGKRLLLIVSLVLYRNIAIS